MSGQRDNRVKRVIDAGGVALATPVGSFQGPAMPELIGLAGFDAAVIDLEHGGLDLQQLQVLVLASEVADVTPIVRVPSVDAPLLTRLLDMGVQGVQLSGVSGLAEAEELVRAVRFPPEGARGLIGTSRGLGYRSPRSLEELEAASRNIVLKVTIEDLDALNAVEEIAAVDGIDLIGVGPNDLSAALGVVGRPDAPELAAAMARVVAAARATGRRKLSFSVGHPAYPLTPRQVAKLGVALVPCQPFPERRLLDSLSTQVREIRSELPR